MYLYHLGGFTTLMPIQLSWTGASRWHASFAESSYLCNVANCFPAIVTINQFLDPRDFRQLSQSCGISYLDCHVVELRVTALRLGVDPEFTEVPTPPIQTFAGSVWDQPLTFQ